MHMKNTLVEASKPFRHIWGVLPSVEVYCRQKLFFVLFFDGCFFVIFRFCAVLRVIETLSLFSIWFFFFLCNVPRGKSSVGQTDVSLKIHSGLACTGINVCAMDTHTHKHTQTRTHLCLVKWKMYYIVEDKGVWVKGLREIRREKDGGGRRELSETCDNLCDNLTARTWKLFLQSLQKLV